MNLSRPRGQILVVFAITLLALVFFVGLAIDAGSLYVTYGHLKRAVDAASVAAANSFKRGEVNRNPDGSMDLTRMIGSAEEALELHNLDMSQVDLVVRICDADGILGPDPDLQTVAPFFYTRCPDTLRGEAARRLVYVRATQHAPLYFLSLMGFGSIPLTTDTISEAASVDLVIAIDISESMAEGTPGFGPDYDPDGPGGCNLNNSCKALRDAKEAAKALVDKLYDGYDRVGLVTFDSQAVIYPILDKNGQLVMMSDDLEQVKAAIDRIKLHDDPPFGKLWAPWRNYKLYNPVNPEDLDGDGSDYDDPAKLGYTCPPMTDPRVADRWWSTDEGAPNPFGVGGVPCDDNGKLDAFDWDGDGVFTQADHDASMAYYDKERAKYGVPGLKPSLSFLSTCTGCGIRAATRVFEDARPDSIWVLVLLSDGFANLSDTYGSGGTSPGDTPNTGGAVPAVYPNGFCNGKLNQGWWPGMCRDNSLTPRYCIDVDPATCPPGTTWVLQNPEDYRYSVMDYAMDMIDQLALTKSTNPREPRGNDVAIYAIGLGNVSLGEKLLRYAAAVGDDGDRTTDPCASTPAYRSCGQYYYTSTSSGLLKIFEDIASRIYTRITD
ncbi:vWA domain-containing protein [uncultured Thermanaerothrix sp.]|uniref:vWA domain-containing protein n=1 Tax=uncultured Thermanaerothrix sp. TaxID=1195149 RepID=UPI00260C62FB|nr:vWA domain-containing protein [uncultured Thermanaerothrix sp.]